MYKRQVLNRWRRYFQYLLIPEVDFEMQADEVQRCNDEEGDEVIPSDVEYIEDVICKLKNNRIPGIDRLCAELFKAGGQVLQVNGWRGV